MRHPVSVATIVALSSIAHAQAAANPAPAQPQYSVDGTLIPADYFANEAPRGGPGAGPVSTAFTYQGFLESGGAPANAAFDMSFLLLDDIGNVIAGPTCIDNVAVSAGIFTVQLDFGAQFDGRARRLGIAVRPGGPVGDCANPAGYTPLTPAQPLTATPYALGLRLPYSGVDNLPEGDVFSVTNTAGSFFSSGILGVHTASPVFSFIDAAGVRGEGSGFAVAGVLGVTDNYVGVVGYGAADGATGTFGRTDGANSYAIRGLTTGPDSWAGYFEGRGYFSGRVGIGTTTPEAALDVIGNIRTNGLRISDNAGAGRTLVSDAQGNGTWTATNTAFIAGGAANPTAVTDFLSPIATITISAGQKIHVTTNRAFGSVAVGGAASLDIYIGWRVAGSGAIPTLLGGGIFNLTAPQNSRYSFGISGIITGLAPGTYEVGMAGDDDGNGNWNNNEWGYVSVFTLN